MVSNHWKMVSTGGTTPFLWPLLYRPFRGETGLGTGDHRSLVLRDAIPMSCQWEDRWLPPTLGQRIQRHCSIGSCWYEKKDPCFAKTWRSQQNLKPFEFSLNLKFLYKGVFPFAQENFFYVRQDLKFSNLDTWTAWIVLMCFSKTSGTRWWVKQRFASWSFDSTRFMMLFSHHVKVLLSVFSVKRLMRPAFFIRLRKVFHRVKQKQQKSVAKIWPPQLRKPASPSLISSWFATLASFPCWADQTIFYAERFRLAFLSAVKAFDEGNGRFRGHVGVGWLEVPGFGFSEALMSKWNARSMGATLIGLWEQPLGVHIVRFCGVWARLFLLGVLPEEDAYIYIYIDNIMKDLQTLKLWNICLKDADIILRMKPSSTKTTFVVGQAGGFQMKASESRCCIPRHWFIWCRHASLRVLHGFDLQVGWFLCGKDGRI